MSKQNKIFLVFFMTLFILVSTVSSFGFASSTKNSNEIVLEFRFSKPVISTIKIRDETFSSVTLDGLPNTHDLGKPVLPVKPVRILLPYGKNIDNIQVDTSKRIGLGSGFKVEAGGRVVPVSIIGETQENYNVVSLSNNDLLFSNVGVYSMRGFLILYVNLYPVSYDLSTGELSYYDYMKIIVETKDDNCNKAFRGLSRDFDLVEQIVDNPQTLDSYKPYEQSASLDNFEYIIITNNALKNSNEAYTFQDLISYKNDNGVSAKIITTEEIMLNSDYFVTGKWGDANPNNPFYDSPITGDNSRFNDKAARIRNFIRYAYTELGTDYVLLGGDGDVDNSKDNIIPPRGLFANESGLPLNSILAEEQDDIPSDVYYACLDGNFNYDCDNHFGESKDRNNLVEVDEADFLAEVWVGRCCADSGLEVSNFVEKTLKYANSKDPYLSQILFVGEDLGSSFYFPYGGDYKDLIEYLVPSSYKLNKFYDSYDYIWDPYDLVENLLTVQPQIINHDGHGYPNYMLKMGADSFFDITNEKPFFIYSHSCLTGSFDNYYPGGDYGEDDCIAEILTCESPYGAYACILNARYGLGSEDSPIAPSGSFDESFYKALFTEKIKELGRASHFSKEDNIWRIDENGYRWCFYQTNLFGDPSLKIKNPADTPPGKPVTPEGPSSGKINTEYSYKTSAVDPNIKQLYYLFDWGDGTYSEWMGPYASGAEATVKHTWDEQGSFQIKVKAKNTDGTEGEWSDPLSVSMPKNKAFINRPIMRLLRIIYIFSQYYTK